ncbi:hypothetical protein HDU93_007872 [Gonapodya sp. JEL0774]|nr:hypothetical protein HDU93_007872 [Gonapodya sp. JEL0774]
MENGRFYDEREQGPRGFGRGGRGGGWGPGGGFGRGRGYGGPPRGYTAEDRERERGWGPGGGPPPRGQWDQRDARERPYPPPAGRDERDRRDGPAYGGGRDYRAPPNGVGNGRHGLGPMELDDRNGHPPNPEALDGPPPPPLPPPPPDELIPAPPPVKRVPLSLEEILAKKTEEKSATDKPKFLTKEERAQLAIERRQQEVEAEKQRQEEERKHRMEFLKQAEELSNRARFDSRYDDRYPGGGRFRDERRDFPRGSDSRRPPDPRDSRGAANGRRDYQDSMDVDDRDSAPEDLDEGKLKELTVEATRARYMGAEKKRRKLRKANERKFVFDWDAGEDTSIDKDPLYAKRREGLLFGRGTIAGVDPKLQREQRGKFWEELVERRMTEGEKERVTYVALMRLFVP